MLKDKFLKFGLGFSLLATLSTSLKAEVKITDDLEPFFSLIATIVMTLTQKKVTLI